ncbi:MAG TPA: hypothetical protein VK447_20035 [Myxococcaceae bacterium]|nr:hypothetical protein [Myxococcaceae bacterium]
MAQRPAAAPAVPRPPPQPGSPAALAQQSDRVALVKVGAARVELPDDNPRRMMTVTPLDVVTDYFGTGPKKLELLQLGGRSGQWEAHLPGDAMFEAGESAVVFLRCRHPKERQKCTLVGLAAGKMRLMEGGGGKEVLVSTGSGVVKRPLESVVSEVRSAGPAAAKNPKGAR